MGLKFCFIVYSCVKHYSNQQSALQICALMRCKSRNAVEI